MRKWRKVKSCHESDTSALNHQCFATGNCCNIHLPLFSPHKIKIDSFPAWGKMFRAFVANKLLNYQVLLLPSVHDFFPQQVRDIIDANIHPINSHTPLFKKMLIFNLFIHQKKWINVSTMRWYFWCPEMWINTFFWHWCHCTATDAKKAKIARVSTKSHNLHLSQCHARLVQDSDPSMFLTT